MKSMLAADLVRVLGTPAEPFLLDVREPSEVTEWPLPGALNIPLRQLGDRLAELPVERDIVVVCAHGNRSQRATHALEGAGYRAINLEGGMAEWGEVYDTADLSTAHGLIVQVRRRGRGCLGYVIGSGAEALVVDPSLDLNEYTDVARAHGWSIRHVADTHLHADHLSGARLLAERTGASLHMADADVLEFPAAPLHDGGQIVLDGGTRIEVAVIGTPGHTRGSVTLLVDGAAALTGDVLFVDGVGRPDLADRAAEFAADLHRSIHDSLLTLGAETLILPAHHSESTRPVYGEIVGRSLGELRDDIDVLNWPADQFVAWAAGRATPRPHAYAEIIAANRGLSGDPRRLRDLEVGGNHCAA